MRETTTEKRPVAGRVLRTPDGEPYVEGSLHVHLNGRYLGIVESNAAWAFPYWESRCRPKSREAPQQTYTLRDMPGGTVLVRDASSGRIETEAVRKAWLDELREWDREDARDPERGVREADRLRALLLECRDRIDADVRTGTEDAGARDLLARLDVHLGRKG